MSDDEHRASGRRFFDEAAINREINSLLQQHPHLIDKNLINSKEVVEASEKLSSGIIDRFRQKLAL